MILGIWFSEFKPDLPKEQVWGHQGYLKHCFKTKQKPIWNQNKTKQIKYIITGIEETYTCFVSKMPNPMHAYYST